MTKFAYAICADNIAHLAQYNKYSTFMGNAKIVPD